MTINYVVKLAVQINIFSMFSLQKLVFITNKVQRLRNDLIKLILRPFLTTLLQCNPRKIATTF